MKRSIAMPKAVADLVADLRERHLLLPIAALLVAIVAVPLLLGGGAVETPPAAPPVAATTEQDTAELDPAVLMEQPGVRNYRRRLAALQRTNPFEQRFAVDPKTDTVAVEGPGSVGDPSVTVDSGDAATSTSGSASTTSSDPVPTPSTSTTPTSVAPSASAGGSQSGEPAQQSAPEVRYYAGRIDVKMGTAGSLKTYENVRYLDFLPSAKEPVVTFVGLTQGGAKAVFAVSREVSATKGEGSCAPRPPAACQFVRLGEGEERSFTYGEGGPTYRLKLVDARIVRVSNLPG